MLARGLASAVSQGTELLLYRGEGPDGGDENFFLTMIEPPARPTTQQIVPREYIFVLDRDAPSERLTWTPAEAAEWVRELRLGIEFAGSPLATINVLGPAVVALGWPLWQRRSALRARGVRFVAAALIGGSAAAGSAVLFAWALGLPHEVLLSLAPKSVTAPVAMGVAEKIGGIPALAAVFAVVTGLVGALSGKYLFDAIGIATDGNGWIARGFALGTASHGIGAARALQVNAEAGAWAALALGLQAVLASVLIPLVSAIIG